MHVRISSDSVAMCFGPMASSFINSLPFVTFPTQALHAPIPHENGIAAPLLWACVPMDRSVVAVKFAATIPLLSLIVIFVIVFFRLCFLIICMVVFFAKNLTFFWKSRYFLL